MQTSWKKKYTNAERLQITFGVNIMLMHPQADQIAAIVADEKVPVVMTGAGNPAKYMIKFKAAGIYVISSLHQFYQASCRPWCRCGYCRRLRKRWTYREMTTMTLVPQADAVSIPVIAAGGIADNRQMRAFCAWCCRRTGLRTCLLVSSECPVHENYKPPCSRQKVQIPL